jgi:chromosome segregation ATPase
MRSMPDRNLAAELSLLATEVDSLAKALAQAQAELALEREHRRRAESQAEELRQQLRQARRRAKAAEHEVVKVGSNAEAAVHRAEVNERELHARLEQAQQTNEVLRHEVAQTESERQALEMNLREVLGNLRHAAQKVGSTRGASLSAGDEGTVASPPRPDNGW